MEILQFIFYSFRLEQILPLFSVVELKVLEMEWRFGGVDMFGTVVKKAVCTGILALLIAPVLAQVRAGLGRQKGNGNCLLQSMPIQSLDDMERANLLRMREEEKLARDVYRMLYSKWSDSVFNRIANSEQRHMDAVGLLLSRYETEDPVSGNGPGEFSNPEIQDIYEDLTHLGQQSLIDALRVGATIEDLDLYDLAVALDATDNEDIRTVYENLYQGSRNHMQAFVGRMTALGEIYVPQHINEEALADIIASSLSASGAFGNGRGRGPRNDGTGRGMCLRRQNSQSE
ncbi:MAG: DUF2202 domain-containing protein [Acidobacteriota bacterium]